MQAEQQEAQEADPSWHIGLSNRDQERAWSEVLTLRPPPKIDLQEAVPRCLEPVPHARAGCRRCWLYAFSIAGESAGEQALGFVVQQELPGLDAFGMYIHSVVSAAPDECKLQCLAALSLSPGASHCGWPLLSDLGPVHINLKSLIQASRICHSFAVCYSGCARWIEVAKCTRVPWVDKQAQHLLTRCDVMQVRWASCSTTTLRCSA